MLSYPLRRARLNGAALVLVSALAAPAVGHAKPFTFAQAEFLPSSLGLERARAFLADALPPGTPMEAAVARLRAADMSCRPDGAGLRCEYLEGGVRPEGGDEGEDVWTVRLVPAAGGALGEATVAKTHVGMPGLIPE
jgi:hypothetical protein